MTADILYAVSDSDSDFLAIQVCICFMRGLFPDIMHLSKLVYVYLLVSLIL